MPTDFNLGDLLRSGDGPTTAKIDVDAVIRRARRRRAPRVVGTALASVLAVVVIVGGGILGLPHLVGVSSGGSASSAVDSSGTVPKPQTAPGGGTASGGAETDGATRCGFPPPGLTPTPNGLVLTVKFPGSTAPGQRVTGIATLTNTGPRRVSGASGPPIIALSRSGIVIWHNNTSDPVPLRMIDLKPGASVTYDVAIVPLDCGPKDDPSGEVRDGLPAAPSGSYSVSASITVTVAGGSEQVAGPATNFTIR